MSTSEVSNPSDLVWLRRAAMGVGCVLVGMLLMPLSVYVKDSLGQWFGGGSLAVEFFMVVGGSAFTAVSIWNTSLASSMGGRGVMAWGLMGAISPLFAYLFLLPWGLMFLASPFVIRFLAGHLRK